MRHHKNSSSIRPALAAILLTASTALSAATLTDSVKFNIQPQALETALMQFSKQTGITASASTVSLAGKQAAGVSGEHVAEQALKMLLADSGLVYRRVNSKTVVIAPKDGPAARLEEASESMTLVQLGKAPPVARPAPADNTDTKNTQQMVVEGERVRETGNIDITRTETDPIAYTIFDAEAIEMSGAADAEEFLKLNLPMNSTFMTNDQGNGGTGLNFSNMTFPGAFNSQVDLRGMGTDRTLILVNGKRSGPGSGAGGQIDLNAIPIAQIERIEVLPSSGSGIYGASAMGGVVNIILKRDYDGGRADLRYERSDDAGDTRRTASISYGLALEGGRTRLTGRFNIVDAEPLRVGDREDVILGSIERIRTNKPDFFTSATTAWVGPLPNIVASSAATTNLTFLDGTLLGSRATRIPAGLSGNESTAARNAVLRANAGLYHGGLPNTYQSNGLKRPINQPRPNKTYSFGVEREMSPWLTLAMEAQYSEQILDTVQQTGFSRVTVRGVNSQTATSPASPFNPFRESISISLPVLQEFPLHSETKSRSAGVSADFKLPFRWTGLLDVSQGETDNSYLGRGSISNLNVEYAVNGRIQNINGVLTQTVVPTLNPFRDVTEYPIDWSQFFTTSNATNVPVTSKGWNRSYSLRLNGPIPSLPWADQAYLTVRGDHVLNRTADSRFVTQLTFGRASDTSSVGVETQLPLVRRGTIPLVHALSVQVAARADSSRREYGTPGANLSIASGAITSYQQPLRNGLPFVDRAKIASDNHVLGLMYAPIEALSFRLSTTSAFNPPTISQMTPTFPDPANQSETTVIDPKNGGVSVPEVLLLTGGNPNVGPETSESISYGLIWRPRGRLEGVTASVDYSSSEREGAITTPQPQFVVDNEDFYPERVTRDVTGRIVQVDVTSINLYKRRQSQVDTRLDYRLHTSRGDYTANLTHTWYRTTISQVSPTNPGYDTVGFVGDGGNFEHRANLSLGWQREGLSLRWAASYADDYKILGAPGGPRSLQSAGGAQYQPQNYSIPHGGDTVKAQVLHDFTLGYSTRESGVHGILSGITVRLAIRNIFGTEPPGDISYGGFFYVNPLYRLQLRNYQLTLAKEF